MERGNTKHSPRMDEGLEHETHGLVQGNHPTRAEEWHDPEPEGEDQRSEGRLRDVGTPPGIDQDEVGLRSELARWLGQAAYPGDRDHLLEVAARQQAPEAVLDRLRMLPAGHEFVNVADVASALGLGVEQRT